MSEIYYWLGALAFWLGAIYGVFWLVVAMINLCLEKVVVADDLVRFIKWRRDNKTNNTGE